MSALVALQEAMKVEEHLNQVDYSLDPSYVPSDFALRFVTFIKLVNGEQGEENQTPIVHYRMLDTITWGGARIANLCHRGVAKTTVMAEYLFLYLATYGDLPVLGKVDLALYVSDSIENGVKNMRKNLQHRWENSEFLQTYVPLAKFTDIRWEFRNTENKPLIIKGYGGKALSLDSLLYTAGGTTTMGACQVGDRIYGPDGKLTTITYKSEIFHKPMYRLVLEDGRTIKVSEDHINAVVVNTNPHNTVRLEEMNLTTKELLALPLTHTKLGNKTHRGTTTKALVHVRNTQPLEYPEQVLPLDPYVLGLLLGDGSLKADGSTVLHAHKDDMAFYLTQIPYQIGTCYRDKRNNTVDSASLLGVHTAVAALGLRGCAMDQKHVPEVYFRGSIAQRQAVLAGLLDTDGTVSSGGRITFCCTSRQLTLDVAQLARSLGGTATTSLDIQRSNPRYKPIHKVEVWLQDCISVFRLPRKQQRVLQNAQRSRWLKKAGMVAVTAIEPIATEPSQCIAVDNVEHQYLTDNYFRTHNTGVRGAKELGKRPQLAVLDDLVSDEDARSPTIIAAIEDTIYKAVNYALHPKNNMIIWSGTPFNSKDPLYKAVESGAWAVNVFPVCERFPCEPAEFRGSWPDRFNYEYVKSQYDTALKLGKVDTFNQELMLRIMSDDDRSILDSDIVWYKHANVTNNPGLFNFYITTDFATSESQSADFSVISVWAYTSNGDWLWVDGVCKRQLMDRNIDDLFRLAQQYRPQQVGIEVTGQQGGFIAWIMDQMMVRNIYFPLASENNNGKPGVRPNTNKMVRFNTVLPWFKAKKVGFPQELRTNPVVAEAITELSLVSPGGFKSKHDDFIDTISMLSVLTPWKPSQDVVFTAKAGQDYWEMEEEPEIERIQSYIV